MNSYSKEHSSYTLTGSVSTQLDGHSTHELWNEEIQNMFKNLGIEFLLKFHRKTLRMVGLMMEKRSKIPGKTPDWPTAVITFVEELYKEQTAKMLEYEQIKNQTVASPMATTTSSTAPQSSSAGGQTPPKTQEGELKDGEDTPPPASTAQGPVSAASPKKIKPAMPTSPYPGHKSIGITFNPQEFKLALQKHVIKNEGKREVNTAEQYLEDTLVNIQQEYQVGKTTTFDTLLSTLNQTVSFMEECGWNTPNKFIVGYKGALVWLKKQVKKLVKDQLKNDGIDEGCMHTVITYLHSRYSNKSSQRQRDYLTLLYTTLPKPAGNDHSIKNTRDRFETYVHKTMPNLFNNINEYKSPTDPVEPIVRLWQSIIGGCVKDKLIHEVVEQQLLLSENNKDSYELQIAAMSKAIKNAVNNQQDKPQDAKRAWGGAQPKQQQQQQQQQQQKRNNFKKKASANAAVVGGNKAGNNNDTKYDPSKIPCKFLAEGDCKFGDKCRFLHGKKSQPIKSKQNPNKETKKPEKREKQPGECFFCGSKDHKMLDCPQTLRNKKTQRGEGQMASVKTQDEDEDDEEEHNRSAWGLMAKAIYYDAPKIGGVSKATSSDSEGDGPTVRGGPPVTLDSAASEHVTPSLAVPPNVTFIPPAIITQAVNLGEVFDIGANEWSENDYGKVPDDRNVTWYSLHEFDLCSTSLQQQRREQAGVRIIINIVPKLEQNPVTKRMSFRRLGGENDLPTTATDMRSYSTQLELPLNGSTYHVRPCGVKSYQEQVRGEVNRVRNSISEVVKRMWALQEEINDYAGQQIDMVLMDASAQDMRVLEQHKERVWGEYQSSLSELKTKLSTLSTVLPSQTVWKVVAITMERTELNEEVHYLKRLLVTMINSSTNRNNPSTGAFDRVKKDIEHMSRRITAHVRFKVREFEERLTIATNTLCANIFTSNGLRFRVQTRLHPAQQLNYRSMVEETRGPVNFFNKIPILDPSDCKIRLEETENIELNTPYFRFNSHDGDQGLGGVSEEVHNLLLDMSVSNRKRIQYLDYTLHWLIAAIDHPNIFESKIEVKIGRRLDYCKGSPENLLQVTYNKVVDALTFCKLLERIVLTIIVNSTVNQLHGKHQYEGYDIAQETFIRVRTVLDRLSFFGQFGPKLRKHKPRWMKWMATWEQFNDCKKYLHFTSMNHCLAALSTFLEWNPIEETFRVGGPTHEEFGDLQHFCLQLAVGAPQEECLDELKHYVRLHQQCDYYNRRFMTTLALIMNDHTCTRRDDDHPAFGLLVPQDGNEHLDLWVKYVLQNERRTEFRVIIKNCSESFRSVQRKEIKSNRPTFIRARQHWFWSTQAIKVSVLQVKTSMDLSENQVHSKELEVQYTLMSRTTTVFLEPAHPQFNNQEYKFFENPTIRLHQDLFPRTPPLPPRGLPQPVQIFNMVQGSRTTGKRPRVFQERHQPNKLRLHPERIANWEGEDLREIARDEPGGDNGDYSMVHRAPIQTDFAWLDIDTKQDDNETKRYHNIWDESEDEDSDQSVDQQDSASSRVIHEPINGPVVREQERRATSTSNHGNVGEDESPGQAPMGSQASSPKDRDGIRAVDNRPQHAKVGRVRSQNERNRRHLMILDSAASEHMSHPVNVSKQRPLKNMITVHGFNGDTEVSTHHGNMTVHTQQSGDYELENVVAMNNMPEDSTLISIPQLDRKLKQRTITMDGRMFVLRAGAVISFDPSDIVMTATLNSKHNLYLADESTGDRAHSYIAKTNTGKYSQAALVHLRSGHRNMDAIYRETGLKDKDFYCEACAQAKAHEHGISNQLREHSLKPGTDLHGDLLAKKVTTAEGMQTGLFAVCATSAYWYCEPTRTKTQVVPNAMERMLDEFERLSGNKCMEFTTDKDAMTFKFQRFKDLMDERKIKTSFAPRNRLALNGMAERHWKTAKEATTSMMVHANLPMKLWAWALIYATICHNRMFGNRDKYKEITLENGKKYILKTPLELLQNKPQSTQFPAPRVLGSLCFVFVGGKGFFGKSYPAIFLGISIRVTNAYVVMKFGKNAKIVDGEHDLTFDETQLPFASAQRFDRWSSDAYTGKTLPKSKVHPVEHWEQRKPKVKVTKVPPIKKKPAQESMVPDLEHENALELDWDYEDPSDHLFWQAVNIEEGNLETEYKHDEKEDTEQVVTDKLPHQVSAVHPSPPIPPSMPVPALLSPNTAFAQNPVSSSISRKLDFDGEAKRPLSPVAEDNEGLDQMSAPQQAPGENAPEHLARNRRSNRISQNAILQLVRDADTDQTIKPDTKNLEQDINGKWTPKNFEKLSEMKLQKPQSKTMRPSKEQEAQDAKAKRTAKWSAEGVAASKAKATRKHEPRKTVKAIYQASYEQMKELEKAADVIHAYCIPHQDSEEEREIDMHTMRTLHACVVWGSNPEPVLYSDAISSPQREFWIKAMGSENSSLEKNGVYVLCDLPKGRKAIGNKWVYKLKLEADGSYRYKARLVAKGFSQTEGLDYNETFAPTTRMTSLRTLIAHATKHDWEMAHLDIVTAFLHGTLEEEIYMKQPKGFEDGTNRVCKLIKSLYGLKQSSRQWNKELHKTLTKMGFKRIKSEHGMYKQVDKDGNVTAMMAVWTDDIAITYPKPEQRQGFVDGLEERYAINDLGDLKWIVGMRITRDRPNRKTTIDQQAYTEKILENYSTRAEQKWAPMKTPFNSDKVHKLCKEMSPSTADEIFAMKDVPYRSAIGALMYLSVATRPDISCAVATCARYMTNPGKHHWTAVKRIFRYLAGTSAKGLVYDCSGSAADTLECFSDSDWAADQDKRRSTTGYVVYLYGCAISWKSKLQKTVAHSSTEAEYMAMSDTAKEVMWLRGLLDELEISKELPATKVSNTTPSERDARKEVTDRKYKPYEATKEDSELTPTMMLADNQGAIQLAKNPVNHDRSKHIDIKHHYIREMTEDGAIIPTYVNTKLNDADMFTKTTSSTEDFIQCRDRVMGYNHEARRSRQLEREKERNLTVRDKQNKAREKKAIKNQKKKAKAVLKLKA